MSECRCRNDYGWYFLLAMMPLWAIIIINADDQEPLTPEEKLARDEAWNKGVSNAVDFVGTYWYFGIALLGMVGWHLYNQKNYSGTVMVGLFAGVVFFWFSGFMDISTLPVFQVEQPENYIEVYMPIKDGA